MCFLTLGFYNGQLLVTLSATIEGFCRSHLLFDYEEVPDPLAAHDVMVSTCIYKDVYTPCFVPISMFITGQCL